jgi:hypothetical protein
MITPSLAMIPQAYKSGKVYSQLPVSGDGDFDFTRASSATRVNKDGLIETVTGNTPRLDYIDSSCPSLLLEPQRTNYIQYSEDFSQSYWINNGVTITSNEIISPSGALNADLLSGVSGGFGVVLFSTWSSTNKVASCFAKKGSSNTFRIENGSSGVGVAFDLENGVVTVIDSGFEAQIQDYGNDWYRCVAIDTLGRSGTFSLSVTAASESIYLYGAQLEEGSYSTSYIPTNGAAVTRAAETAIGAGDASTFNDSEGVLMFELSALTTNETRVISISDGSTANNVYVNINNVGAISGQIISGGTAQCSLSSTSVSSNISQLDFNKIAITYKLNDFQLWVNGIKVDSDNNGVTFSDGVLNRLNFDFGTGAFDVYGNVKQLQYFDSALTDAELQALTTI